MVNEEYNPTYYQDGKVYPDGNIYYPENGQQVLGANNYVAPTSSFIQVLGSENSIGNDCQFISLSNSSGCIIQGGLQNVSLVNSSGVTVTESNIQYVAGKRIPADSVNISIKRTLTALELTTGYSSPIEVIPTPGAGKVIEVVSAFAKLRFNSVVYDTLFIGLMQNIAAQVYPILVADTDGLGGFFPQENVDTISKFQGSEGFYTGPVITGAMTENAALYAGFCIGDPTTGDSEIDLYITYRIVTL